MRSVCGLHILSLLLLSTLIGCTAPAPPVGVRLYAMATWVDITAANVPDAALDAAVSDIETFLRDFERDYYAWGDGELARLNAALAEDGSFEASPALADLIREARAISIASGGAFEPAVGALVEAWGFHDAAVAAAGAPAADTLTGLLGALQPISTLVIDDTRIASPAGPTTLDLGGIAKGRAVDRIIAILQRHGISDALVEAGGDLRVIGQPPGRRWRIGVQDPRGDTPLATLPLTDGESAFTSGDYERYVDTPAGRAHHLLDPASGYPATHTQAVTVLAETGTLADAAATAIFVAGPDRWRQVARALGISRVLRVDGSGLLEATPAMRDRLQISDPGATDIIEAPL